MPTKSKSKTCPARKSAAKRRMTDEEKARLIEEGEAQLRAGLYVEHERVVKWMMSWGTSKELPMPQPRRRSAA